MFNPYDILIFASILIMLSYIFNIMSSQWKIPSVLFLIFTGIVIKYIAAQYDINISQDFFSVLELLGIIGLIMIVLEAAVDLKVSRSKINIIRQSILISIIILVLSSIGIAFTIMFFRGEEFFKSLVYAIPLSVVSSAVLIPSVHALTQKKKEFLIYESTFSDIIGIMFFNYVVLQGSTIFSISGIWMIISTIFLSVLISYFLVYLFSRIKTDIKLFLMIAILAVLYALGKKLHLSPLLMIFIFGLVLNNPRLFFKGALSRFLDFEKAEEVRKDFRTVTAESAFVMRTFFFVAFGMIIDIGELLDWRVLSVGTAIVVILYIVRYINFKVFVKSDVFPEIFLAPRGLITILLFFTIPVQYQISDFKEGILFFVILATSLVMFIALISSKDVKPSKFFVVDYGLEPSDSATARGYEIEIKRNINDEQD